MQVKNEKLRQDTAAASRPAALLARTVHTPETGAVRTRFVLHPSYQQLATQIDRLNKERPVARATEDAPQQPAVPARQVLTRQLVLRTMARFPDGVLPPQLCQEAMGRSSPALMQRLYALLAREVDNGNIEEASGRGALRRLTVRGRTLAADFEVAAAREKDRAQQTARQMRRAIDQRVNGIFDYAAKIDQGVIAGLSARKALA